MPEGLKIGVDSDVQGAVKGINTVVGNIEILERQFERLQKIASLPNLNFRQQERLNSLLLGTQNEVVKAKRAFDVVNPSINKYTQSSNSATAATINLSRVVQDAPFGFLGIANNLNPLLESFQRLRATSGSTGGALKAFGKSLTGAGGIGLALGVVSSALVLFGDDLFGTGRKAKEAADEIKKANEALANAAAADIVKLTSIVAVIQNVNTKQGERVQALKALNDEYGKYLPGLDKEKISLDNIAASYDKIIDAILRQAVIKGLQEEIEKAVTKTAAAIIAAEKAQINSRIQSEKTSKAAVKEISAQDKLAEQYAKTNRVVSDGTIAQQRATREVVKSSDAFNNLEDRVVKLKDSLKKELAPLFDIMKDFNLEDLKITIKDDKSNDSEINKIIARAKRLASEIDNVFVVPTFSAADSQAESLRKAQKFLDDFFSARLVIRPDIRFGFNEVVPPPELKIAATTMAQMFGKEFNRYFEGGNFDFSIGEAITDELRQKELSRALGLSDNSKSLLTETQRQAIAAADAINSALTPAFQGLFDAILAGENPMKAFFTSLAQSVAQLIQKLIAAAIQAAILSALFPGGVGQVKGFGGFFKNILGFAAGGIVSGPTLALIGEGAGTSRSNPEVVAPLDQLRSMLAGIGGGGAQTVYVTGRLRGRDMVLQNARTSRSQRRTTGR